MDELLFKNQMFASCMFIYRNLNYDGTLKEDFTLDPDYEDIKYIGDIYPFVGGIMGINAGIIGHVDDGIIITFRGTRSKFNNGIGDFTQSVLDWRNTLSSKKVCFRPFGNGKVFKSFFNSLNSIIDIVDKTISLIPENSTNFKIYITGHSKGGVMAVLFLRILEYKLYEKAIKMPETRITTFGTPKIGTKPFKIEYDNFLEKLNIKYNRYESFYDIFPHIPLPSNEKNILSKISLKLWLLCKLMPNGDFYSPGDLKILSYEDSLDFSEKSFKEISKSLKKDSKIIFEGHKDYK